MKKLVLISAIALMSLLASAIGPDKTQYVVSNGVTIACQNIKKGVLHLKAKTTEGETVKIDNSSVQGYYKNGYWYQKMPRIKNNKPTNVKTWMKLVGFKYGLSVYQKDCYCPCSGIPFCELYIFEGDRFVCQINEKNKGHLLPFLGLKEKN